MGNYIKLCLAVSLIWALSFAQEPNVVWTKTYGGALGDIGHCVQQTNDGGFIIVGQTASFATGHDVYLVKTDCIGNMEWYKTFGGSEDDMGYYVQQTRPDNGYIIVGETWSSGHGLNDVYLIKTDPFGTPEWWRYFGGTSNDIGLCVQQTTDIDGYPDGYIIVGVQVGATPGNVYLIRTTLGGGEIWSRTFGGNQSDAGYFVQQTYHDPGYIITGRNSSFGKSAQAWVIKTDANGYEEWNSLFGGAHWDEGRCVRETDDGYIIAGWYQSIASNYDVWLFKTDYLGTQQWNQKYGGPDGDKGYSVQQTVDNGYIITGCANPFGPGGLDVYIIKTDPSGNQQWFKTVGGPYNDRGYSVQETEDRGYIIAGFTTINPFSPPYNDVYLIKLGDWIAESDDPLALAYNGNRHLVRKPNSEELHLVYNTEDKVMYMYSANGGTDWILPEIIGEDNYPAITLSSDNLPSVTWTDDEGGLWYRRQTSSGQWSDVYHLYNPTGLDPSLNSPPSITIIPSNPDVVHILVTRSGGIQPLTYAHTVDDYSFPITDPSQGTFELIEEALGPLEPPLRTFPSITKDFENGLHAVWQRVDTICYATREIGQPWNNWGNVFDPEGLQSAHPFVETYGDSVFVVWQRETNEEVYRGARHQPYPFGWENLSLTPRKVSLYPVNASGFVTTFVDETDFPPPDDWYEIYWKRKPEDPLNNISESPHIKSIYPHTSLKFNQIADNQLYVVWQEGNISPYEIKFKMVYVPDRASAFFSSNSGNPEPSPYLVARDTFFDNWTIPVDVGDETITYQFPLEPGYLYKAKTIAYHESSGEWQGRIKIDNAVEFLVRYNAHMPETLEIWIPPILYQDSIIEVVFNRLVGDYAAMGPLYIYRYEYEEGRDVLPGGSMAQDRGSLSWTEFLVTPTLITERANILLQMYTNDRTTVKIYDASGRLVKNIFEGTVRGKHVLQWDGGDEVGRVVPVGVYFVQVRNRHTGATICKKVLKVR